MLRGSERAGRGGTGIFTRICHQHKPMTYPPSKKVKLAVVSDHPLVGVRIRAQRVLRPPVF